MIMNIIIYTLDEYIARCIEIETAECFSFGKKFNFLKFTSESDGKLGELQSVLLERSDGECTLLIADGDALSQKGVRTLHKILRECEKNKIRVLLFGKEEQNNYFVSGRLSDGYSQTVFLQYPFSLSDFRNLIIKYIGHPSQEISKKRDTKDSLIIDRKRMILRASDRSVSLTEKEYGLFMYLYERTPRPVSRAELLLGVWGKDSEQKSNITDVYINYLRLKLKNLGVEITVRSVRGIGYRLEID